MSNKVLFIGVQRDGTGYSHGACEYLSALNKAGVDTVARSVKLNNFHGPIPKLIEDLEAKSTDGCNINIQYILPHLMVYDGRFDKNIALFANETHSLGDTNWARHLNKMDEIWVINEQMKIACINSGVTKPIEVIKHPIDIDRLKIGPSPLEIPQLQDKFVFYFIGEFSRRKNLSALLQAFHTEFYYNEPVALLIKTHVPNMTPTQAGEFIKKYCDDLKSGLKLYKTIERYIPEVIIANYLSEEQILQLHATGDCLVTPSYGEAWSIPTAEAMALGKTPIVTDTGGLAELINDNVGWNIECTRIPCFGMIDTFQDLYTANDDWDQINIRELQKAMRQVYSDPILRKKKSLEGLKRGHNYSYDVVGGRMKTLLQK